MMSPTHSTRHPSRSLTSLFCLGYSSSPTRKLGPLLIKVGKFNILELEAFDPVILYIMYIVFLPLVHAHCPFPLYKRFNSLTMTNHFHPAKITKAIICTTYHSLLVVTANTHSALYRDYRTSDGRLVSAIEFEQELELIYGAKHVILIFIPVTICMLGVVFSVSAIEYLRTDDGQYL